jgi:hypothetical protein
MAILGMAYRATNDIDLVLDLDPAAYDDGLDDAYLRRHAAGLGVSALLDETVRRAGS